MNAEIFEKKTSSYGLQGSGNLRSLFTCLFPPIYGSFVVPDVKVFFALGENRGGLAPAGISRSPA